MQVSPPLPRGYCAFRSERAVLIGINTGITERELRLRGKEGGEKVNPQLHGKIAGLNRRAIRLLNGLIEFKGHILSNVRSCRLFTMNYPLLIEHILREAKLYRDYVNALENGTLTDDLMKNNEQFWNRIMMEHAMFI
ncbi:MAG: DUF2935 domain-containing protein [Candidatus Ornithomonoglobus sp.]